MFKQTLYKVLHAVLEGENSTWKEEGVKTLTLGNLGIEKVTTDTDEEIIIDSVSAFAREFTTMFDKNNAGIFGGDIIKFPYNDGEKTNDILVPINWINGGYCIVLEELESPIYLTQQNVLQMEVVGNIYQHQSLLEKEVDEAIFEKKEEGTEQGH